MAADRGYDVVVIGTGSGGKIAAIELARAGRSVLAIEAGRFGGECPYVACVPAKSLLYSARAGLTWADAVRRRDEATDSRDDEGSRQSLVEAGVTVRRGRARLLGRGQFGWRVQIDAADPDDSDRAEGDKADGGQADGDPVVVEAERVVLATGSSPVRPDLPGLDQIRPWTSVDALSTDERPNRMVILGGGAVGCELAQAFATFGTAVTVVEVADRLLPGEAAWVGRLVADALRAGGVDVVTGVEARRVGPPSGSAGDSGDIGDSGDSGDSGDDTDPGAVEVELADGRRITADRLLLAGGRAPSSSGLGLEAVGAATEESGAVTIDARCRVLDEDGTPLPGLFAVGDLTAASAFTHSANYQARIVADEVEGPGHDADYAAVPRAVYIDPPVFCVGLTAAEVEERGDGVRIAGFDVSDVERAALVVDEDGDPAPGAGPGSSGVRGRVELVADADTGVLVAASCVGPEADSWGAELALAVRARLDVELLVQHIRAFPTWSEAIYPAARELAEGWA